MKVPLWPKMRGGGVPFKVVSYIYQRQRNSLFSPQYGAFFRGSSVPF